MKITQRWVWLPLILFFVLSMLLAIGLLAREKERPSARLAMSFPDFSLPVLNSTERRVGRELLNGHITLVNVWGSWCPSCEQEIPAFLKLHHDGVHIVGVLYRDGREDALGFLARHGNPYDVNVMDAEGRLSFDLGVYGAPESFIVDAKGVIRYHHAGVLTALLVEQQILPLVRELVHET